MNANLLVRVQELARYREHRADVAASLKAKREQFDADNAALLEQVKNADIAVANAERDVRALAEAQYKEDQQPNAAPGVVVKLRATMDYDKAVALDWAKQTGMALVPEALDEKAFAKIAKATPLDFVTYDSVPMVTIATDLAKALAEVANA